MRPERQANPGPNEEADFLLNNQRNNNRRRGRGSNRGGSSGGGNQGNRIDSRARGNAPQLLEKYRKLAHEASLNDDRVQTEYYLQFADHYFRVIADGRTQKDDGRPQRRDAEQGGYDGDDYDDEREDNRDGGRESGRDGSRDAGRDGAREGSRDNRQRQHPRRQDSASDEDEREPEAAFEVRAGAEGDEDEGDNPFAARSRRKRPAARRAAPDDDQASFDPGLLPPSIARSRDADEEPAPEQAAHAAAEPSADDVPAAEKPRRRLKMPRTRTGDEEELEAAK